MKLRLEKSIELIILTRRDGLFLSLDLVSRWMPKYEKFSVLLLLFWFIIVSCFLGLKTNPFISEYKRHKRTDQTPCLLYGECYNKFKSRSGSDGMANWFSRVDNVLHISEGCSGNSSHPAKSLPWETRRWNPLQPPQSIWILLDGMRWYTRCFILIFNIP